LVQRPHPFQRHVRFERAPGVTGVEPDGDSEGRRRAVATRAPAHLPPQPSHRRAGPDPPTPRPGTGGYLPQL
jgi:hypothetical protein